jgi:hypothetical protein
VAVSGNCTENRKYFGVKKSASWNTQEMFVRGAIQVMPVRDCNSYQVLVVEVWLHSHSWAMGWTVAELWVQFQAAGASFCDSGQFITRMWYCIMCRGRRGTLIDYWWESQRERDH